MLRSFRENIRGTFGKVLLAIIIIPFVGFGAADLITGRGEAPAILSVNGEEIDELQFVQELNVTRNEVASRMGPDADYSQLTEEKLAPVVKQRFISSTLIRQFADSLQVSVPSGMLDQAIVGMDEFKVEGKFSQQHMQLLLANSGLSLNTLRSRMENDIRQRQINAGVGASGFATGSDIDLMLQVGNEARSVDWLLLSLKEFGESQSIEDAAIREYYDANPQQFQTELVVDADYILLSVDDYRPEIGEEQILEEYENRKKEYATAGSRRTAHILLEINDAQDESAAREKLNGIRERILAGESFAALAREYSQDVGSAAEGGDLGVTEQDGSFPEPFEAALFELAEGEVSAPVLTDAGLHLIQASEITASEVPSLDEIRADLVALLQRSDAEKRYVAAKEELANLVFNSEGLSEPAESLGVVLRSASQVGRGVDEQRPEFTEVVLSALFSDELLDEGLNSELIELDAERSIVVSVNQSHPPRTREFESVKEGIREQLLNEKAVLAMQQRAEELAKKVEGGESFKAAAAEHGYTLGEKNRLLRQMPNFDPAVLEAVFGSARSSVGNTVHSVSDSAGNLYLYQLVAIEDGRDGVDAELRAMVVQQASLIIARQEVMTLLESLRQQADIQEY